MKELMTWTNEEKAIMAWEVQQDRMAIRMASAEFWQKAGVKHE
jgi:hypothetical protein